MKSLHDYVTQIYYTHGLFCASHPFSILTTVICFMLISFYPLTNAPLPGSIPLEHVTPVKEFQYPLKESSVNSRFREETDKDDAIKPRWYKGTPVAYIQQIVAKVTVSPWKSQYMIPEDAFRSPLSKVFEVLEELEKTKLNDGTTEYSLSDICFRVSESTSTHQFKDFLPQYSCLVLSPANFWQVDKKRYLDDAEILRTIFKRHGQPLEVPPYLRDILFGIPWKKSGISRYFIRNRQKTIMFAVTIVMKKFDHRFLNSLRNKLEAMYPETVRNVNNSEVDKLTHLHYGETKFFSEYAYLLVTYAVLLLYLHFSIRKIEMVKSKWGLALSAVVTVVSSLLTSVSICTLFGLQPTLNGGEIFPYLVMFVGLENVLVITKSVVSTPVDLDVKYRIAQGISREGWSITKNLATELIIVIGGFFTFVPAIQEFALFALVGLLTDFFLQMVFFLTVLSIDIRRMELSDLHKSVRTSVSDLDVTNDIEPLIQCPVKWYVTPTTSAPTTKKHTRSSSSVSIGPPSPLGDSSALQASRRLRVIDFLANTRMIQRIIMVCTVIWIALIVYKSGLVEHLTNTTSDSLSSDPYKSPGNPRLKEDSGLWSGSHSDDEHHTGPVQHKELELWKDLSYKHWPTLFSYYNISLYGKFISILPSLHLSVIIDPNKAINLRHPAENIGKTDKQIKEEIELITQEIRSGKTEDTLPDDNGILDSLPHYMYDSEQLRKLYDPEELKKLYPKSKKELFITILLIVFSVICLSYFALALYHCICPRNYAKWRSRWFRSGRKQSKHGVYYKQMKESVPIVLKGHLQEIECVVTDGQFIISSCLGGQIRVWDSLTGDCITAIYRKSSTPPVKRRPCVGRNIEDSDADLYAEYHGDSSSEDLSDISSGTEEQRQSIKPGYKSNQTVGKKLFHNEPDLSSSIETNFLSVSRGGCLLPPPADSQNTSISSSGYDFSQKYGQIYEDHKSLVMEDEQRDDIPDTRARSWSVGDLPTTLQHDASLFDVGFEDNQAPSIWCISCQDGLIVAGCGNGRIEFWDGSSGSFKYMYGESTVGVTALCFIDNRIVAARLDGSIDFLELETFHNPVQSNNHVKGHVRQHSQAKVKVSGLRKWEEILHINLMKTIKAHQQPVVMLQCEGRRVVSASHDHTLRVFRLEDCLCLYTLHGHTGKITVIYLDKGPPYNAVSGDSDGSVRLWDLHTGSCMHKVNAHEGAIVALTCTTKFVVSSGLDNHLIIWERTRGCVIHSLNMDPCGNNSMALLSRSILVTSSQSCINLLDINKGEVLRTVHLGNRGRVAFVNQIKVVQNTVIVCDYASEMKVIQFPTILEKSE